MESFWEYEYTNVTNCFAIMKKVFQIIIANFAVFVGIYPAIYFFVNSRFGLLSTKSELVLNSTIWNIFFYTHIFSGGIALLIGWIQFNKQLREKRLKWHRNIGKTYVLLCLISSLSALVIAQNATGGLISILGFSFLALFWLYFTFKGYVAIRQREVVKHQNFMLLSYAATFAAVTLRIWLPVLVLIVDDFFLAYKITAWVCWVPNIIVAWLIIKKKSLFQNTFTNPII